MKFIIDAQLPKKLSTFLSAKGFDSIHTLDLPKGNKTSDTKINEISIEQKRVLITKDSDFYNSYLQKSEPYKLIFLTMGNISTKKLLAIFDKNLDELFNEIKMNSVVEVSKNTIITIL